jgi:DtxR family transcriptional regulator, Mn-dependent transcriptional regulator
MVSSTVEDYIKAIYTLQRESAAGDAGVGKLATVLGVTNGTVTAMTHKLKDAGLVKAEKYGGLRLTAKGTRLALDVIRRHRLIEVFLVDVLKFDWSEVHDEAERLEHAMSPKLIEKLDCFLGHPQIDPHGDPIPDAKGKLHEVAAVGVHTLPKGASATIARINDQDASFLAFAARHGLRPGAACTIQEQSPEAESVTLAVPGCPPVALSYRAAKRVLALPDAQAKPRAGEKRLLAKATLQA